jgi:hypothetical protein
MAIKDWEDKWKIPFLTQEILSTIEEEELWKEKTQPEEVTVPNKPMIGQKKPQ